MPLVVTSLIVLNALEFLAVRFAGRDIDALLALWPLASGDFHWWQPFTYAFLHGSTQHLFFNMLGLWMFGGELERLWGRGRFLFYYAVCVLAAALMQTVVTAVAGSDAPTIGASGGVFGLLVGFAMEFPHRRIVLLIPPIPMPAWLFVTLYGLVELTLGATDLLPGIAHFAHLGGLLGGVTLMLAWRRRGARGGR